MTMQPTRDQLRAEAQADIDSTGPNAWAGISATDLLALLDQLDRAEARIKAVRDVHQPLDALHTNTGRVRQVCTGCGTDDGNWQVWPCPTIRALDQ